ncbi:hypothetical protein CI610_03780 [invertebrate metagenome]|uniref:Uncharacterized protein n=1 Tax=invertebrate metagenome TaxID=1711999 RepID=A0A2H9T271_9ZZZZ
MAKKRPRHSDDFHKILIDENTNICLASMKKSE